MDCTMYFNIHVSKLGEILFPISIIFASLSLLNLTRCLYVSAHFDYHQPLQLFRFMSDHPIEVNLYIYEICSTVSI